LLYTNVQSYILQIVLQELDAKERVASENAQTNIDIFFLLLGS
jgi:hypothetical protein